MKGKTIKIAHFNKIFYVVREKDESFYYFKNEDNTIKSRKYLVPFRKILKKFEWYLDVQTFLFTKRKIKFAKKLEGE